MESSESSDGLSPTAEAFAEFLTRVDGGEPLEIDAFCAARPALAPGLRRLHERWRGLGPVLAGLAERDAGAEPDAAEAILARLRREPAGSERITVREEVARGGMGTIFKVWDRDLGRLTEVIPPDPKGTKRSFHRLTGGAAAGAGWGRVADLVCRSRSTGELRAWRSNMLREAGPP